MVEKRMVGTDDEGRYIEDKWEGNSNPRLKLLETLGYITREDVLEEVPRVNRLKFWFEYYRNDPDRLPVLYKYQVVRNIPSYFLV
jgi:hypothetical protein